MSNEKKVYEEKIIQPKNGWLMLAITILSFIITIVMFVIACVSLDALSYTIGGILMTASIVLFIVLSVALRGFRLLNPNEAVVLLLFGKYYGTVSKEGFYYVNPFTTVFAPQTYVPSVSNLLMEETMQVAKTGKSSMNRFSRKISLKAMTLVNGKQKVNDQEGNPIEIGVIVIWRIVNTAQAVFNVDNYYEFISTQSDSAIRHVARCYPYDLSEEGDEKSLRGSSQEIAEELKKELQNRINIAGIEIMEARISHLAYAPEIAAAMLQRQQARAIIDARQKIVEGAVGMVEMALNKLSENKIVELDGERKAQMVSNLLVVLCGNKDAQPIVNSGSIY